MKRFYAMTASAERVMKAETFPDDCLELVLDVRVMQSFFRRRSERFHCGTLLLPIPFRWRKRRHCGRNAFRFVARPYCDVPIGMDWKREMLNNIRMVGE